MPTSGRFKLLRMRTRGNGESPPLHVVGGVVAAAVEDAEAGKQIRFLESKIKRRPRQCGGESEFQGQFL
ncbi:hypothetical protein NL676_021460 [Syzygium grande]|nr:hypothetical protein NL676_021460 [Syzygium grande]